MKSKFFKAFGIPDTECEIEPRLDEHDMPRLFFRSKGNPGFGLDLTGARKLQRLMTQAGEIDQAKVIEKSVEVARQLALKSSRRFDSRTN